MFYLANILHPVYGGKHLTHLSAMQRRTQCYQPAEVLPEVPMETSDIEEESELTVDSHINEVLLEVPEISESQDSSYMSELSGDTRRDKRPRLDDVIPEERPVIFEVISGGSKQGVNKLISSDGYTFTAKIHEDRKINVASRVLTRKNAPPPGSHVVQPTGILFSIGAMNLLTKFHEDRTVNVASRVLTRFYYSHIRKNAPPLGSHFFQANIIIFDLIQDIIETNLLTNVNKEKCPAPGGHVFKATKTIFELIQDIFGTNLLTKFHDDRNINVTSRVLTRKIAPPPWWPYIIGMNLLTEKNAPPLGGHVFQANVTIFKLIQDIIKTSLLTIFHQDWTINRASRVLTRKNAPPPGGHVFQPTGIIFKFVQDIIGLNLLTKFHEDWTINVASRVKNAPPLGSHVFQAKVTIFELIQDISGTNLLRKFHEDRKINVASRVLTRFYYSHITNWHHFRTHQTINVASRELTRQMLTPHNGRWTKSDHKSSP
ncbi:hypothetical protein DPMN_104005 [Dreissena polymorpha]|uniref:Uncharacterized protein n=1 Tax=Dreissena polymorpha TaxID=45954 RepID=A0A9D4H8X8_DREPO|nr:hypothetical protein DPMN_104005 [Dreissena polymorpha]